MSLDWINYHHLLYFWTIAKEGSISAACQKLHLAQPTISGQLKKLETQINGKLFDRTGRNLVLTDLGQTVFKYADEMFTVGQELVEVLKGQPSGRPLRFHVGVPEVLPKLIVFRLLKPLMDMEDEIQLICHEGSQDQLLTMLAAHELDVVFSDSPAASLIKVKAFNHHLGASRIGLFGTKQLIRKYGNNFPEEFSGAPLLLPGEGTALRRSIDHWLRESDLHVSVRGEFDDTALMKVFAESGMGFIAAPLVIQKEIARQFSLDLINVLPNAKEEFYAISVERRIRHPAVVKISEIAKQQLFVTKNS